MLCVHRLLSLSLYGRKEMLIQIIAVVWMECKKVMKEYLCKKKHNQRSMQFTLATNDFIEPARTLGYSLCEVRTKVDRVAMGYQHFCSLITPAGWTILHVQPIYAAVPPVFDRWKDMFTKLLMWNYKVWQDCRYLDADTLVLRNFEEVFDLSADFSLLSGILIWKVESSSLLSMQVSLCCHQTVVHSTSWWKVS